MRAFLSFSPSSNSSGFRTFHCFCRFCKFLENRKKWKSSNQNQLLTEKTKSGIMEKSVAAVEGLWKCQEETLSCVYANVAVILKEASKSNHIFKSAFLSPSSQILCHGNIWLSSGGFTLQAKKFWLNLRTMGIFDLNHLKTDLKRVHGVMLVCTLTCTKNFCAVCFTVEWDGGRVIVSLVALQRTALRLKLKHWPG